VRGPRVLGLEGVEDPVVRLVDPERVPGNRARLRDRELAAGLQELAELRALSLPGPERRQERQLHAHDESSLIAC
jgi:hypothetical protein